jgi:hypothetical protein
VRRPDFSGKFPETNSLREILSLSFADAFWSVAMKRIIAPGLVGGLLGGLLAFVCGALPAAAGDFGQVEDLCYRCIRDAIYADVSLINHLEANPDLDDGVKGPQIIAARADIHRLRALLGPVLPMGIEPCCYSRPRLYIR